MWSSDVDLSPTPTITYRAIGGDLEFHIFLGPTPDQVVQQYTQVQFSTFFQEIEYTLLEKKLAQ